METDLGTAGMDAQEKHLVIEITKITPSGADDLQTLVEETKAQGEDVEATSSSAPSSSVRSSSDADNSTVDSEDSDSSISSDKERATKKKSKKSKKAKKADSDVPESDDDGSESADEIGKAKESKASKTADDADAKDDKDKKKKKKSKKRSGKPEFFRADQIWDRKTNSFKLKKTAVRSDKDEYGQYIFHVRRCFDGRGELERTVVDIKSNTLKKLLEVVMGSCKDVSFAEAQPEIDPNMIFLYLEDIREFKEKINARREAEQDEKRTKQLAEQVSLLECLIEYMDKDYERLKAKLRSLTEAGDITFDLLWTLFRSDDIAYLPTYSTPDEPRAIRVNFTYKANSMMKGVCFCVEGEFFNYDGKNFGLSTCVCQIDHFEGTRRITSLPCYPFKYHATGAQTRQELIERGKKFVNLLGTTYRSHMGLGFMRRENKVIKVSVSSRIMIDPVVFRRTDPNYPIPTVKPDGASRALRLSDLNNSNEVEADNDDDFKRYEREEDEKHVSPALLKLVLDQEENPLLFPIELDDKGEQTQSEEITKLLAEGGSIKRDFTEEELLISSPVVLGFAFTQKLWLEFTVSGIHDIEWNDGAFESLVLPERQKSLVKALVTSHASVSPDRDTIDDVIKGKGKGLVAVLHGTPGVGKTLTAEGIADLLRRPLYYVSAGELGTNPRDLETELTKILDVAQTWGAVLLLDEAEVFLESRTAQDIHRNALVSIFLRVLEYFQGILFLTSNRVTSFDAAFQSRIHFALRYHELDFQARRSIFKMFIDRVVVDAQEKQAARAALAAKKTKTASATNATEEATPAVESTSASATPSDAVAFSEADLDRLARRSNINGRQIKNAVRSAQALSMAEGVPMGVAHVMRVLEVAESFEQDLKGGTGYMDAMRAYN